MASHFQNAKHFLAILPCLVLLALCSRIEAGGNGKQKHFVGKVPQNATERQDSVIFSKINQLISGWDDPRVGRVPPNYLQVVLNASGVLGLGFLWIKEISAAIGTPILAPILIPPLMLLAAAILLIPDLSRIGELIDSLK